jgi:beta-glucosidase
MTNTVPSYKVPSLPVEVRVADLMARMTIEEKIAQLYQIWVLPENALKSAEFVRKYGVGSRILASTNLAGSAIDKQQEAGEINEFQRIALEDSRLGIPILFGRDVIHGFRTIFPIPLGMAAAWDPDLLEQVYSAAAREARSAGINYAFAPMLDIARDPRWGRMAEGSGEDPYLTARNAAAAVRGFQGSSDEEHASPDKVLACAKHYIGYGAAEGGRDYNTSEISETTLRNIYLPPFTAAVNAGLGSLMSGFHDLNGESASGSAYLLTQLLKEELGFEGFVISDWGSVTDLVNHRLADDARDAARLAFNAGVDMEMVTSTYVDHLKDLVELGKVPMERIDEAVQRVLSAKIRFGLFENPYVPLARAAEVQFCADHQALARRLAARSMVLLKNDSNLLPLCKTGQKIALIGPLLNQRSALLGSWTLDGLLSETATLWEAAQAAAPNAFLPQINDTMSDEMLLRARTADVVVYLAGESASRSGENSNSALIELPPGQAETVEALCDLGKPVVLVVFAGRALNLTRLTSRVSALIYAWHPGSLGASALMDLLFGDVDPVGRLPVTLPRHVGQVPAHYNFKSTGKNFDGFGRPVPVVYSEAERYQDLNGAPLYPFGFGLGYTTFSYSAIQIDQTEIGSGDNVTVSALVTNTGRRSGEELAQCYVQDCVASITRPVRELKGFARLLLQPGETRKVSFTLGPQELSFYGLDGTRRVEPGAFKVWIGPDCRAALETAFKITH